MSRYMVLFCFRLSIVEVLFHVKIHGIALFQAIHCRSIVPCQDTPSVKCPYEARVSFSQYVLLMLEFFLLHLGKFILEGMAGMLLFYS